MSNDLYPNSDPMSQARLMAKLEALDRVTALTLAATTYVADSVNTKTYASAVWDCELTKGTAKRSFQVQADHDGSTGADATAANWAITGKPAQGTVDVVIICDVSGAGAAQVLNLKATPSTIGWTLTTWRRPVKATPA